MITVIISYTLIYYVVAFFATGYIFFRWGNGMSPRRVFVFALFGFIVLPIYGALFSWIKYGYWASKDKQTYINSVNSSLGVDTITDEDFSKIAFEALKDFNNERNKKDIL